MELGWPAYLAAFAVSLVLSYALTPAMLRVAIRLRVLDEPGERKAQAAPVPYLGGVAIVLAFSAAVLGGAAVSQSREVATGVAVILGTALVLAVVGLVDDLRGLSPWLRLGLEAGAGMVVHFSGSGVTLLGPSWLDAVATVLWVVLVTNAFNLLDNMDGLSAGVAVVASGAFLAIAALNGQFLVAALAAALAGCALGFLRHNAYPAKIYMGDAGSLFLGFLLAVLGSELRLDETPPLVALFVPVLILGVALFDTTLVVVARLRHGRSPFQGGRDHTSHRLVWVGIPVPVAVGVILGAAVTLGWLALLLARLDTTSGLMLVGLVLVLGAGLLALLYVVPVYDNSRRRIAMLQVVRAHEPEPVLAPVEDEVGVSG